MRSSRYSDREIAGLQFTLSNHGKHHTDAGQRDRGDEADAGEEVADDREPVDPNLDGRTSIAGKRGARGGPGGV